MADRPAGAFKTHSNYIRALAFLAGGPENPIKPLSGRLEELSSKVLALPSIRDRDPATIDLVQLKRSLSNAWGTEVLLGLGGHLGFDDELTRLTNNWAVTQAYYVTYHATQAFSVAQGQPRLDSHPKTQKEFISHWVDRGLQLPPWNLAVDLNGSRNFPAGFAVDDGFEVWSACNGATCWQLIAKALRTTRDDHFPEARKQARYLKKRNNKKAWQAEEDARLRDNRRPRKEPDFALPRLSPEESFKAERSVRAHGFMDYLYRLRLRATYVDSTMFTDGPEDESASGRVHADLALITSTTLLVHELHIKRIIGETAFMSLVDDWLRAHGSTGIGLFVRRDILEASV